MKLYIKQKVFSWKDRFTVKDELGDDRYTVEGEMFSWGKKLHVYDRQGREVVYIEQQIMTWMPRYHIYVEGSQTAEIVQKFAWFRPAYEVNGPGWTVSGSFWEHEYEVTDQQGTAVVSISKELMSWGDSYELDIGRPQDELLAMAVVLTIDCVKANQNS